MDMGEHFDFLKDEVKRIYEEKGITEPKIEVLMNMRDGQTHYIEDDVIYVDVFQLPVSAPKLTLMAKKFFRHHNNPEKYYEPAYAPADLDPQRKSPQLAEYNRIHRNSDTPDPDRGQLWAKLQLEKYLQGKKSYEEKKAEVKRIIEKN